MKNKIKKLLLMVIIIVQVVIMSGCWDNRDIADMGFVVAMGFDKSKDNNIELTAQIIKPSVIKSRAMGGGEQSPVWVISDTGETVFEAVRNLLMTSNRKPYYQQTQLIVIGEDVAREGIMDVLDMWERDIEGRLKAKILIAKGIKAGQILRAVSELEDIPAMHIVGIMKNSKSQAKIRELRFFDVLKEVSSKGSSLTIGAIEVSTKEEKLKIKDLKVQGTAVFRRDKLVGWLSPEETKSLQYAKNDVDSDIVIVPSPINKKNKVTLEVTGTTAKTDVKIKGEQLVGVIEVTQDVNIGEQFGDGDLTTPENMKKLEAEASKETEKRIRQVVITAQKKYKSDIFGFGEIVHRKWPVAWKGIENEWEEVFAELPVEIKVTTKLRRSGLITKSVKRE